MLGHGEPGIDASQKGHIDSTDRTKLRAADRPEAAAS